MPTSLSIYTSFSSPFKQISGDVGEVGLLNGATLLNPTIGSMKWSAPSAVGWGGTLRNMGALSFTGTVSLEAAADSAGFVEDGAGGAWPTVVHEEGGVLEVEAGSEVAMDWLLWNEGGQVLVSAPAEQFARKLTGVK